MSGAGEQALHQGLAGHAAGHVAPGPRRLRAALPALGRSLAGQMALERARYVNWLPVLFGLGIGVYFWLPVEPSVAASLLPLACGGLMWALGPRHAALKILAGAMAITGGGLVAAKLRADWVAAPVLERQLRAAEVQGIIETVEPHAKRGQRLTLRAVTISGMDAAEVPRRVRVRSMVAVAGLKPGDGVRLTARLAPPAGPSRPGDYDFARASWFAGIGAVGYALKSPERIAMASQGGWRDGVQAGIQRLRGAIGQRVAVALPGVNGAIATALITGERSAIPDEINTIYRDSGLFHILSISGLHMAIMAGAVFASVRFGLAAVPALALRYPTKKWAAAAGIAGAVLYLAISGGAAATIRSCLMMVVMFVAVMLGRPALALRNVALSALVILLFYPESLLDAGFQMSFAAVVALVSAYESLQRRFTGAVLEFHAPARAALFLAGIVFSTLVASLAVTPLSVYHFHKTQQYAALANLVAIPVCNLAVMPAALATLVALPFGLEALPLAVMGQGLDVMTAAARWVAAMPGAVASVPAVSQTGFLTVLAGGLWLTLWQQRWRLAGIPLILAGLALAPLTARPDILVGRGGALVAVRQPNGLLAAAGDRASEFELKRWLDADGDGRDVREARRGGFACDTAGCVTTAGSRTVALSRHPASLAADCARADILIIDGWRPLTCTRPALLLDRDVLRHHGTHAVYLREGRIEMATVAGARGIRPWSPLSTSPRSSPKAAPVNAGTNVLAAPANGVAAFAAPRALLGSVDPFAMAVDFDDEPGGQ